MIKREKTIRLLTTSLIVSLLLSFPVIFIHCNNDDDEEVPETLAGIYIMEKVTITEDYTIGGIVIIPSGTDVTEVTAQGILSAAPCENPANGAVELREGGQLYLVCIGESDELIAGTWDNSTPSVLALNLSNPPFPQNLQLNVTDIIRTSNTIEGNINPLILTPDLIENLLPEGVTPPPAILLAVKVIFAKSE
jgi:hypothetical protein